VETGTIQAVTSTVVINEAVYVVQIQSAASNDTDLDRVPFLSRWEPGR
jgi:hypothetical protein